MKTPHFSQPRPPFVASLYNYNNALQPFVDSDSEEAEEERATPTRNLFREVAFGDDISEDAASSILPIGPPIFPQEILDLIIDFASSSYHTDIPSPTLLTLLSASPRLSPRCRFHLYRSVVMSTTFRATGIDWKLYTLTMRYNVGHLIKYISFDIPSPSPKMWYWETLSAFMLLVPNIDTLHIHFAAESFVAEEDCEVISSALGSSLVTTLLLTAGFFSCSGIERLLAVYPHLRRLVATGVTVYRSGHSKPFLTPEFIDPDAQILQELEDLICTRCTGFLDTVLLLRQSITGIPFRRLRQLGIFKEVLGQAFPPVGPELQELIVDLSTFSSACAAVLSDVASVTLFVRDRSAIDRLLDCASLPRFNPLDRTPRRFAVVVSWTVYRWELEALTDAIRRCTGGLARATVCITFPPRPANIDVTVVRSIDSCEDVFIKSLTSREYRHPVRTQTMSVLDDEIGRRDFGDSLYY